MAFQDWDANVRLVPCIAIKVQQKQLLLNSGCCSILRCLSNCFLDSGNVIHFTENGRMRKGHDFQSDSKIPVPKLTESTIVSTNRFDFLLTTIKNAANVRWIRFQVYGVLLSLQNVTTILYTHYRAYAVRVFFF